MVPNFIVIVALESLGPHQLFHLPPGADDTGYVCNVCMCVYVLKYNDVYALERMLHVKYKTSMIVCSRTYKTHMQTHCRLKALEN